jgi:hypothetical protein
MARKLTMLTPNKYSEDGSTKKIGYCNPSANPYPILKWGTVRGYGYRSAQPGIPQMIPQLRIVY